MGFLQSWMGTMPFLELRWGVQASGGSYGFCAQELQMGPRRARGRSMQRKERRRKEKAGQGEENRAKYIK